MVTGMVFVSNLAAYLARDSMANECVTSGEVFNNVDCQNCLFKVVYSLK